MVDGVDTRVSDHTAIYFYFFGQNVRRVWKIWSVEDRQNTLPNTEKDDDIAMWTSAIYWAVQWSFEALGFFLYGYSIFQLFKLNLCRLIYKKSFLHYTENYPSLTLFDRKIY